MKDIYIIGAGGFGREVADTVHDINKKSETYNMAGFIDDDSSKWGMVINDIEVKGGTDFLFDLGKNDPGRIHAVIAVGDPDTKVKLARKLDPSVTWENIIHPTAIISGYASIGEGNTIQSYALVNANVKMGNHCLINAGSGLGHDVVLNNYVSIMSKCDITGNCVLKDCVYVATSVCVIPGIVVEKNAFLGAGSVIVNDVETCATMIGNPARRVK